MGILITVLVIIVIAAGALMAPGLNVSEVYCEGNVNIAPEELVTASGLEIQKNILISNVGRAERNIGKLPFVEKVSVKRVFPDKICIRVTERVPAAYVKAGTEGAVVDINGVVLHKTEGYQMAGIISQYTPEPEISKEEDKPSEEEKTETEETEETESEETEAVQSEEEEIQQSEEPVVEYSIPFADGFEIKDTDEGKKASASDKVRFDEVLKICEALRGAGLLERCTYIDVTNMGDIRIMIENRLDVRIGNSDNIGYRAKFLAQVINEKISAYEKAVMDYRGDDIYVRAPEDGKARVVPKETDEEEDSDADEETEDDTEEDDTEASENETEEDEETRRVPGEI